MRSRFLLTLVVILTTFGAVLLSVSFDDLSESDAAYIQGMLKESPEGLSGHRDLLAMPLPLVAGAPNKSRYATGSATTAPSPALVCPSSCVLLC
jgi:hypothetical protein